jgi:hypothetical protein
VMSARNMIGASVDVVSVIAPPFALHALLRVALHDRRGNNQPLDRCGPGCRSQTERCSGRK